MKKILSSIVVLAFAGISSVSATDWVEISCSTDQVFAENSCVQCFDWWEKAEWVNIGLLNDVWSNGTSKPMYMLKAENELSDSVRMFSLNGAAWSYEPSQEGFWEYTTDLEALNHDEGFYTLEAWKSVNWIESKLGYSIKLNTGAEAGQNIGLLKFTLNVHVDDNGTPEETTTSHTECVLFKSAGTDAPVTPKEQPKKLPQTWPQEVLLLLLSLILAAWLFFVSRKKA